MALPFCRSSHPASVNVQPESTMSSINKTAPDGTGLIVLSVPATLRACIELLAISFCSGASDVRTRAATNGMPSELANRDAKSYTSRGWRREGMAVTHSGNGSGFQRSRINFVEASTN